MYIKNGACTELVNTAFVHRFCIVDKEDCTLIIASYGVELAPVTLARYKEHSEAVTALESLQIALCDELVRYDLPESTSERKPLKRAEKHCEGCDKCGSCT